jgi:hypothetical protein
MWECGGDVFEKGAPPTLDYFVTWTEHMPSVTCNPPYDEAQTALHAGLRMDDIAVTGLEFAPL